MLHIVTVATKNEGYFDYLVQSCKRNGATLEVLGWGQEWKGFTMKFELMKKYLEKLPHDDIVCFVDGYDVIILEPVEKIEKLFRESGKEIIVSRDIDINFVPFIGDVVKSYYGLCHGYSINSGTYMGYVKDLKELFRMMHLHKSNDDQVLLTQLCNQNEKITIDIDRNLFLVTNYGDKNFSKIQVKNNKLLFENIYPCILHAAGNGNIDHILKQLGYDVSNVRNRNSISYFINSASWHIWKIPAIFIILIIFIIFTRIFYKK